MKTLYFMGDDNIIKRLSASAIVQRTTNIDPIQFAVTQYYNGIDMADMEVVMEYITPISKDHRMIVLERIESDYHPEGVVTDPCLLYQIPGTYATTALTAEPGDVKFSLGFYNTVLDPDTGAVKKVVRSSSESGSGTLKVLVKSDWFNASDEALSTVAAMITENQRIANLLVNLADTLNAAKADGIQLDRDNDTIYLTSNGARVGEPIDLEALNQELVDVGGTHPTTGNVSIQSF